MKKKIDVPQTPLIKAIKELNVNKVEELIDNDVDVNETDVNGTTPICHLEIIRICIDYDKDKQKKYILDLLKAFCNYIYFRFYIIKFQFY
jgi:hypothetical protein